MNKLLGRIAGDRRAATAVEYGLILSMIVLAMMTALMALADVSVGMWDDISEKVQSS